MIKISSVSIDGEMVFSEPLRIPEGSTVVLTHDTDKMTKQMVAVVHRSFKEALENARSVVSIPHTTTLSILVKEQGND